MEMCSYYTEHDFLNFYNLYISKMVFLREKSVRTIFLENSTTYNFCLTYFYEKTQFGRKTQELLFANFDLENVYNGVSNMHTNFYFYTNFCKLECLLWPD